MAPATLMRYPTEERQHRVHVRRHRAKGIVVTNVPSRPEIPGVVRIHHVGIVVRDAEAAAQTYQRALGLEPVAVEDYRGTAKVAFLRAGETMFELIQPLTDDGPWSAALRDRGEGPHHFALEVIDLRAAVETLGAAGITFLDTRPSRGTGNTLSVFLDPTGSGGTLIELVQQIQV